MKSYLITGGAGFVGRNVTKKLLDEGNEVWIIDNLFTGRKPEEWLKGKWAKESYSRNIKLYKDKKSRLYFIKSDIVDFLNSEIKTEKKVLPAFGDVFHFASVVGGRELIDGDPILIATDLAIDSLFFLWATSQNKKLSRILYASSSAAYPTFLQGEKGAIALKEHHTSFRQKQVGIPDMTYGWSKLTGEYLSHFAASRYGIKIACVRPFSGYGEDQEKSYPIPAIAHRVAKRENPLVVWGSGKQGRDFVHIDDCIDAFFIILDKISDGSAINIGTGKLTSFLEVLDIFTSIAGYQPKIVKHKDKPVGVAKRYADIKKIKSMGWKPKISTEVGFGRVLAHMESQNL